MTVAIGALFSASAFSASAQNSVPTNPWYVPPAAPAPTYGYGYAQPAPSHGGYSHGGNEFNGPGYHQPQAYVPPTYAAPPMPPQHQQQQHQQHGFPNQGYYTTGALPQPSLGAGYMPQQPDYREPQRFEAPPPAYWQHSNIDRGAVPGPYGQQPSGYWQRPQAAPQPAYVAPPALAAPAYRAPPQPYGDYPPLGSDPTQSPRNSADRGAGQRQAEPTDRTTAGNAQATQRWSSASPAQTDPLLAGPTTLAPYGGGYGAPYGAYGGFAPFPGLPFW